ncbi:hypothetical protein [Flavobacterium sp.]|uniref:hypothetical protein n=1 Tax=Flavobacterium sp. TaxID=239 RepID=UPI00286C7AAC|nr:hypothetical protein [Flavobacterium sp.]
MKFKTYIILLLLLSCCAFSQTIEKLKTATKKIYDANYTMDFDSIVKFSYPKMIADFSKGKFLEKLDHDYQNEEYRMRLQLVTPVYEYGPIKKIEGITFCVISYKNPVRYFYENKLDSNTSLLKANFLREKDRTKDVTFEPKRNSFNVRRISKFIAVFDATTNNQWKFFNMDDLVQRQIFETLFEDYIKKQVGY